MVNVYLGNSTAHPIFVTGFEGSDWGNTVITNGIAPGGFAKVGAMTDPTQGASDHWGWIFVALHGPNKPCLQLYVAAGTVRGVFDYCVQYYDGGKNRKGDTIIGSKVEKKADGVAFTIDHVFDPWMTQIPDTKMLHQITLPGTHDSGTRGLLAPSECQSTGIDEQLYMGVRYFDIRVDQSVDGLRVVHGSIHGSANTDLYFKDVADMFARFLTGKTGCPSTNETVVLQVKVDRGTDAGLHGDVVHSEVIKALKTAFTGADDHLYLKPIRLNLAAIPTLHDLRGKLVLLCRYDHHNLDGSESGTPVKYFASGKTYNTWSQSPQNQKWPDVFDKNKFEWPDGDDNKTYFGGTLTDYRNRHGLSFIIQDRYQDSTTDKWTHLLEYLRTAKQGGDSWYLNFASCTPPGSTSATINPQLKAYCHTNPEPAPGGYGTILMDYVDPDLVRDIIGLNF